MKKWTRFQYQPVLPLGRGETRLTGCREHIALSRRAAAEGMVLLKNEADALPLPFGSRVALFGKAGVDYVKGGGGSGDVTVAYVKSLLDGLEEKETEGKLSLCHALNEFYRQDLKQQRAQGRQPGQTTEPELPEELLQTARACADTAIVCICRFSGEGWDRADEDFYLTQQEVALVERVKKTFPKVIVVLNVGGMVDTSWFRDDSAIQAALLAWQGGMEGGAAAADILCGDVNPSGRLVDTFASCFGDYPSSEGFHKSEKYVDYTEDIYVGYRYFETVKDAAQKVNYCFGYGLSYTQFGLEDIRAVCRRPDGGEEQIDFYATVTNLGHRAGKQVLQVYVSAPQGRLGKPARELKAFAKTRELLPGESQRLHMTVPRRALASYDDVGKVVKSAWILEAGTYRFYLGTSVRETQDCGLTLSVSETEVVEQLSEKCAPSALACRMTADGSMEGLPAPAGTPEPVCYDENIGRPYTPAGKATEPVLLSWGYEEGKKERPLFSEVADGKLSLDAFLDSLSDEELMQLAGGQPNTGVANTFGIGNLPKAGVPNVMTADGPAGLRIRPECGVCTTAWPCATLLASSFNEELVEEVGRAGALEVKENNIGVWLTPAMNIHRSPLCGRNFEYYSEDPYVAGKMGAAMIRGIQSVHIAASAKHFACNNKETNRQNSDSRLSERALREIYLKGFEIAVKEAQPWTIMSSYNIINGVRASENRELLTDILRKEWGFEGMVTTDWWNLARHEREVLAGNDLKMPAGNTKRLQDAMASGELCRADLAECVKRILGMLLKLD